MSANLKTTNENENLHHNLHHNISVNNIHWTTYDGLID